MLLPDIFLTRGKGLSLIMGNHCRLWVGLRLSEAKSKMVQLTFYIGPTSTYVL